MGRIYGARQCLYSTRLFSFSFRIRRAFIVSRKRPLYRVRAHVFSPRSTCLSAYWSGHFDSAPRPIAHDPAMSKDATGIPRINRLAPVEFDFQRFSQLRYTRFPIAYCTGFCAPLNDTSGKTLSRRESKNLCFSGLTFRLFRPCLFHAFVVITFCFFHDLPRVTAHFAVAELVALKQPEPWSGKTSSMRHV